PTPRRPSRTRARNPWAAHHATIARTPSGRARRPSVRREDDPNDAVPGDKPDFQYRRDGGIGGKAILLIVAAVLLLIFFLQNLEDANIDFLFWEWDVSLAVAIGV